MNTTIPISAGYRRAIFESLALQIFFGVFAMMFLDGGRIAHTVGIAVLAFWTGAALIMFRRPASPTKLDLLLVRVGFLPVLVVTFALVEWIWSWHWIWKIRGA